MKAARLLVACCAALAGCTQQMAEQPRLEPLERSTVFADGMGSRHLVPGTVPRGYDRREVVSYSEHLLTAVVDGQVSDELPPEIQEHWDMAELLARGRERYQVYCSHCHDLTGGGQGMVPQRGFPEPATYHTDRLRQVPLGHIVRVIDAGRGRMPAHGSLVRPMDRWAIAAYIRALQFSQYADVSQLPAADRQHLQEIGP